MEYNAENKRIQEHIKKTVDRFRDTKELIGTLGDNVAVLNTVKKGTPEPEKQAEQIKKDEKKKVNGMEV